MKVDAITVKVNGRLGNQFFQYAFARSLQLKYGGELYLDFSPMGFSISHSHKDGWVNILENCNIAEYKYLDLDNISDSKETKIQHFLWKVLNRIKGFGPNIRYLIERFDYPFLALFGMYYMESYNTGSHVCKPYSSRLWLRGWFESKKFFEEFDDIICHELTPKTEIPKELEILYNDLSKKTSICVHIRRGDFISSEYAGQFAVCSIDYYKKGIDYIKKIYPNSIIFLCSDDLGWARKMLDVKGTVICEPQGYPLFEIHRLMSACQCFVISNSTFAWWAQHLSCREHKVVVAPKTWRNVNPSINDIYEEGWTLI